MLLFIIVLFLFFLLNLLIKNKKALIITYTLVLVILAGLRGINVGSDTWMYNNIFANYSKVSYLTIFSNFKNLKDPFFYLFIKLLSTLHFNVRMMFIFFSLVYVCSFEKFIYKYSKNVFLSNMLFITLPYYFLV